LSARGLKEGLSDWLAGSVPLGAVLGGIGALVAFLVVRPGPAEPVRFVNRLFAGCPRSSRGFVRWKLRLDRIFDILAAEDLGAGVAVDLGCGYGIALGLAAFANRDRRLVGCDLNPRRIAVAQQAFAGMHAGLSVADVRSFEIPRAGLILILDVLQYLSAEDQLALLARCCAALEPGAKLIFRVNDRERTFLKTITLGFDRLIFLFGRAGRNPATLPVEEYRGALHAAGMRIVERRFVNRLPLAHVLFVAEKPAPEAKV
jgi:SAM-dependent methyltransferase